MFDISRLRGERWRAVKMWQSPDGRHYFFEVELGSGRFKFRHEVSVHDLLNRTLGIPSRQVEWAAARHEIEPLAYQHLERLDAERRASWERRGYRWGVCACCGKAGPLVSYYSYQGGTQMARGPDLEIVECRLRRVRQREFLDRCELEFNGMLERMDRAILGYTYMGSGVMGDGSGYS